MWWWNDYWPMSWAVGPFMLIVVVVLFAAVMLFMVCGMPGGHRDRTDNSVALDILKERFARGEITQAEFEERRRFLEAA
jgi:putative membrane protein